MYVSMCVCVCVCVHLYFVVFTGIKSCHICRHTNMHTHILIFLLTWFILKYRIYWLPFIIMIIHKMNNRCILCILNEVIVDYVV